MRIPALRTLLGLGVALSLTGCIFDDQKIPAGVMNLGGTAQEVAPNAQAAKPLTVQVVDQDKEPLEGVDVVWSIKSGSGTLSATSSTTDDDGMASVTFTAPATVGTTYVLGSVPKIGSSVGFQIITK